MKKKLTMLVSMLLLIVFAAVGCSGKDDAASVLNKAQENSQKAKSLTAKATMTMKLSAGEETMDMNYDMDMDFFTDPVKAKIDMNTNMLNQEISTTMYMIANGDEYGTYTNLNGAWYKQTMDKKAFEEAMSSYDNDAYMKALMDSEDSLKMSEVEEDGKKCYKIEGTVTGDAMKKMIESSNLKEQLAASGADISSYDNLGDLKMTAFIEKDSNDFYKISVDMKDLMEKVMGNALEAAGNAEKVSVDTCIMDMVYTGYDNAEDFELPEEAKDAQELQQ